MSSHLKNSSLKKNSTIFHITKYFKNNRENVNEISTWFCSVSSSVDKPFRKIMFQAEECIWIFFVMTMTMTMWRNLQTYSVLLNQTTNQDSCDLILLKTKKGYFIYLLSLCKNVVHFPYVSTSKKKVWLEFYGCWFLNSKCTLVSSSIFWNSFNFLKL